MITQSIIINLIPSGIPPRIKVSQYDTGAEAIEVTLLNGAEAYEIPAGVTVLLTGRTSGGQVFTKKATTASGSVATFGIIDAMTASAGTAKAEVEILDGQTVLGSANFDIYVEPSPVRKDNTAESDWSDLQAMANAVVAAGKKIDDAKQVVADVTDAANKANEAVTAIGDNVERSETAATSAEAAQTAAEAAQGKAESAQTAAETAEQSASASATTATTKATEAETNASAAAESADAAKAWAVGPSDELTAGTDTDNAKYYAAQAKASADKAESISNVDIATTSTAGIVKPDGDSITVDADGTIHGASKVPVATTEAVGTVKPDGDTITIDEDGTIHGASKVPVAITEAIDTINTIIETLKTEGATRANAMPFEHDLGTSFTDEQSADIRAGRFDKVRVGGYWTINGRKYWAAHADYRLHCGDTELTTHHMLVFPDKPLYNAQMNSTDVTTGAYYGSAMKTSGLADALATVKADFGANHILSHRVLLANAVSNGASSGWAWYDSQIDLMNEVMVYGHQAWGTVQQNAYDVGADKTQLAIFQARPDLIANRETWWLRDVRSSTLFCSADSSGTADAWSASYSFGVRPAFLIS